MKSIRILFATILAICLAVGYLASQVAVLQGKQVEYAAQIDQKPIVLLALIALMICLAFYFAPSKDGEVDR